MKRIGLFSLLLLIANGVFAQSIKEGKKMLDYERFQSAAHIFKQLLEKKSDDTEAAYWLGQTYLQNDESMDTVAAKKLYQEMLQKAPNDGMLMAGMGQIDLLEGKTEEARNTFEAAIKNTKKRNRPEVQYAVAIANVDVKAGDATYAVAQLKEALDRDKNNVEYLIELGNAYRKLIDGANAVTAYQNALLIDPHAARAAFMIGRIYETQGIGQEVIYIRFYEDAIRDDPNFAPVYYWLYTYYYKRDVNKARKYLTQYVSVSDNSSKNCYAQASLFFVSKLYSETIAKVDSCLGGFADEKPFPNLFGLKAYAYDKLGDSANSKTAFEKFFATVNPDNIGPTDYATYAKVLTEFGQQDEAMGYMDKALALDTVMSSKLETLQKLAKTKYNEKKYVEAGIWYTKVLNVDTAYGKVDLYWAGFSDYMGARTHEKDSILSLSLYQSADSIFTLYQQQSPDDLYGWYLGALSKAGMDTSKNQVTAKDDYAKVIEVAQGFENKDTLQDPLVKDKLIPAYRYMLAYEYNEKGNVDSANFYNNQILALDSTDATAKNVKEAFEKVKKQRAEQEQKMKEYQEKLRKSKAKQEE